MKNIIILLLLLLAVPAYANDQKIHGSLDVTGNAEVDGSVTATGGFIGALTGNASTVTVTDKTTSANYYIPFVTSLTGSLSLWTSSTKSITFNPNTGLTTINGDLTVTGTLSVGTLEAGVLLKGVQAGVTAYAGGGQTNGTLITQDVVQVTVVATAGDSIKLPDAVAGRQIMIMNHDATESMDVFPNTSEYINAGAINTAKAVLALNSMMCTAWDATHWECVTLVR